MANLHTMESEALVGQEDRLLKMSIPLADMVVLPQRVIGHARLGRTYEYTIGCVCEPADIELKQLVAQGVTLWLQQADKSYEPVHGYAHTIKRLGSDGQLTFCQLTIAPWLHFLKFRRDSRIWQDKTADDILSDVFNQHPQAQGNFRFEIREPASLRSYCTQYETDWHFAQRLMEEEGWYGYHEQLADGSGHMLVITDSTDQLQPIAQDHIEFHGAGTDDELHKIVHWSADRTLASNHLTTRTHDYRDQGDRQSRLRVEQWESGISDIQLHVVELSATTHQLSPNYIDHLLKFDQRKP